MVMPLPITDLDAAAAMPMPARLLLLGLVSYELFDFVDCGNGLDYTEAKFKGKDISSLAYSPSAVACRADE